MEKNRRVESFPSARSMATKTRLASSLPSLCRSSGTSIFRLLTGTRCRTDGRVESKTESGPFDAWTIRVANDAFDNPIRWRGNHRIEEAEANRGSESSLNVSNRSSYHSLSNVDSLLHIPIEKGQGAQMRFRAISSAYSFSPPSDADRKVYQPPTQQSIKHSYNGPASIGDFLTTRRAAASGTYVREQVLLP